MTNIAQTITAMDLWRLALPVVSRRDHGIGSVEGACEIVVLRLTAEGGEDGFGEGVALVGIHRYARGDICRAEPLSPPACRGPQGQ